MKRKIDSLGRITIPAEMKYELGLKNGDLANIDISGDNIVINNPNKTDLKEQLKNTLKEAEGNEYIDKSAIEDLINM